MKKTQFIFACVFALALAAITSLRAVDEGRKEGKAVVRSVHGQVDYLDGTIWHPVRVNMKLAAGATIRTGKDGVADISVNGTTSAVRITNSTTLQITGMSYVGSLREGDTTTTLNLVSGSVLGNVKKISANSRYEIMTPHGVAGIRGTDFQVEAVPVTNPDGTQSYIVTFTSITGTVTVSAVINGQTVTKTLTTATSWQIGVTTAGGVTALTEALQQSFQTEVSDLNNVITISVNAPGTGTTVTVPTTTTITTASPD
jgi:hypothetical protein